MGDADNLSLYDRLNDSQKNGLNAIKSRILPYAQESLDAKTGDQVIEILESWLMDDEQKQNLASNSWDIFFLYAAASLLSHTNGYKANSAATGALPENDSETSLIHESTNTFWPSFDIEDRQQSEILSLIGKGYLAAGNMAEEIPPRVVYDSENAVNIQFLAACLRLAMGLNLAAPDTLAHLGCLLPPAAAANKDYSMDRHFTVVSTGAHPHVQGTILVQLNCRDAEVHRALKRYESYLQWLLYNLNRLIRPRFLFTSVRFEIKPQGYQPIDFKFGVDTSSALQLFAGNTLYKDRRVFLRELVQNAVDACNLRQMQEPEFTPAIGIEFSPDLDKITFRDNGIGMSKQWIEKYFLNIGLSFYQSDEIMRINRDANIQFSFISQFGIGFLSSFLVAQKVVIKTRQAGSDGFIINITHIDDYFDVRVVEEKIPVGTEVTVILKKNLLQYCRSLEYLGYLKTNLRFLPIALNFVDENGVHTVLGQETLNYDEE
ncbi:MAG: ATP-binding protein, partial [Deltaproteobacteria bacterium]|nr:ATP-binding protein [Deltaproteobacteria bacterium]